VRSRPCNKEVFARILGAGVGTVLRVTGEAWCARTQEITIAWFARTLVLVDGGPMLDGPRLAQGDARLVHNEAQRTLTTPRKLGHTCRRAAGNPVRQE